MLMYYITNQRHKYYSTSIIPLTIVKTKVIIEVYLSTYLLNKYKKLIILTTSFPHFFLLIFILCATTSTERRCLSMEYRLHKWVSKQNLNNTTTDELVVSTIEWFESLQDQDIIELLMTGFIPDTYEENKREEKVFAKLIEVLIGEVFKRIGFDVTLVKSKSEREDLQITTNSKTIIVDAKTYRLGRSQIAPNVKDFIKLHTFENWINNYNRTHKNEAIGGLVVYPSTHEWIKQSQVYKECSNKQTPVVMLSFEILAFLLQSKNQFKSSELLHLWNYNHLFAKRVNNRNDYWNIIYKAISQAIGIGEGEIISEVEVFKLYYEESVKETLIHLYSKIETVYENIPQRILSMNEKEVRSLLQKILIRNETAPLINSIENILKNRKQFLSSIEPNRNEVA